MSGLRCFRRITRFRRTNLPWRRRHEVTSYCGCRSTVTFPTSRKSPWPGGAELPKYYYDSYDPFLSLAAAAAVTKTIKLATGICLVVERDPIHTAKEVSTLDRLSSGRFIFGIGGGWNEEEMANHGTAFATRFKLMRERIEAMKQIWTQSTAAFDGEFVKFEPMMQWPKPVQKPHPPIVVGGAFPHAAKTGDRLRRRLDSDRRARRWIRSRCCRNSVKWQRTPAAIPRRSPSTSSARPETWRC